MKKTIGIFAIIFGILWVIRGMATYSNSPDSAAPNIIVGIISLIVGIVLSRNKKNEE
jgi:uncharacterized membrane protein HdeD (DUF308 family)